jgi:hypothetical protein
MAHVLNKEREESNRVDLTRDILIGRVFMVEESIWLMIPKKVMTIQASQIVICSL